MPSILSQFQYLGQKGEKGAFGGSAPGPQGRRVLINFLMNFFENKNPRCHTLPKSCVFVSDFVGSKGMPGAMGSTGMDGATGATGSPGLIGWQGTKGANGDTGATGTLNVDRAI